MSAPLLPLEILLADAQIDVDNQRFDTARYEELLSRAIVLRQEADHLTSRHLTDLVPEEQRLLGWLTETLPELVYTLGRLDALR